MFEALIDEQKRTTGAIMALAEALKADRERIVENRQETPQNAVFEANGQVSTVSTGQNKPVEVVKIYTRERIVENGREYTPETHPLLFAVVEWLEKNPTARGFSVRKLAQEFTTDTGQNVGKSWAAVAKNYWLNQE